MTKKDTNPEAEHRESLEGASSASGVKAWLWNRAKPYTPPWVMTGATGLVGTVAYIPCHGSAGYGVGLTLGSVALTGFTWWAGKTTGPQRRLHSAVTVAAASSWITGAALAGPWEGPLPGAYFIGGVVGALSWNIRQVMRRNPDVVQAAADTDGTLLEKVRLAGTKIRRAEVEPNRVTAQLALPAGELTNEDVSRALPNIASALDVATTAVRYLPDPDSARRGELVVVPRDMLAEVVEWSEPSSVGASITEPLVIGRYDDGSPLMLWLPGDPEAGRNSTHLLITGMTGSGKGDGALNILTEIIGRRDVIVWLSDPKSFQDFRPLLPAFDWAVEGGAPTETMATALLAVIPARTRWLGAHGYRQWVPAAAGQQTDPAHSCQPGQACGCEGMPFLVAWFEEAAASIRFMGDDAFTEAAQLARAAGISLVVSLQRASHDQMSTSTRASLPSSLAFGVADQRDEAMALPAEVLDAGARPSAWRNTRPGYCYAVTPGVDEQRYSSPGRTLRFTGRAARVMEQLAAWAAKHGAKPDPVTAGAAAAAVGKAYTERTDGTEPAGRDDDDEDGQGVYEDTVRLDPEDAELAALTAEQLANTELSPVPEQLAGLRFGPESTAPDFTPEEARAALAEIVAGFEARGVMVIGPKDVMAEAEKLGRSRQWVSLQFRNLIEEGRLQPTTQGGRYRIVPALAGV